MIARSLTIYDANGNPAIVLDGEGIHLANGSLRLGANPLIGLDGGLSGLGLLAGTIPPSDSPASGIGVGYIVAPRIFEQVLNTTMVPLHADGAGTETSPWTGWDINLRSGNNWPAGHYTFPAGFYRQTVPVICPYNNTHLIGQGKFATVIQYSPDITALGTITAFTFGTAASETFAKSMKGFALLSDDILFAKTGICIKDSSDIIIEDVEVSGTSGWKGGTGGSYGIKIEGREFITLERCLFHANRPCTLTGSANGIAGNLDFFTSRNTTYYGDTSSPAYPLIEVVPTTLLTNFLLEDSSWTGGTGGFLFNGTHASSSQIITFRNIRREQAGTGYAIRITQTGSGIQHLTVENLVTLLNGIYLREAKGVTLSHYHYVDTSGVALDVDATVYPVTLISPFINTGATITTTGLTAYTNSGQSLYGGALSCGIKVFDKQ